MSVGERDPHTGHMTTGHEWNGIRELNTPVPGSVWSFLGAAFVFSVIYWLLMPAWPIGVTFTRGLLGIDDRKVLEARLDDAADMRALWTGKLSALPASDLGRLVADEAVMARVRGAGQTLYLDNCSACHGIDAAGGRGFPNLVDKSVLWGGDAETIMETLRVGINSGHEETRLAQMPALGRDETLDRRMTTAVISYVRSLSNVSEDNEEDGNAVAAGKTVFEENCAACHGDDAAGDPEIGAPNLTDPSWIYGGDRQTLFETIWRGRQGVMPAWEGRLSEVDRKILTLYLLGLKARVGRAK